VEGKDDDLGEEEIVDDKIKFNLTFIDKSIYKSKLTQMKKNIYLLLILLTFTLFASCKGAIKFSVDGLPLKYSKLDCITRQGKDVSFIEVEEIGLIKIRRILTHSEITISDYPDSFYKLSSSRKQEKLTKALNNFKCEW